MSVDHEDITIPSEIMANWQDVANLLAEIFEFPAALIMRLVDSRIEVLIASQSERNPYRPGDSEIFENSGLYCETVIKTQEKLFVPNALADEHWNHNPDIKLNMISYLGFPLCWPDGKPFGTLCILDSKAHAHFPTAEKLMMLFRNMIESHLEIIYVNQKLGEKNARLADYLHEIQAFRGMVRICAQCKAIQDEHEHWQPIEHYLIRHPEAKFSHGLCPKCAEELLSQLSE